MAISARQESTFGATPCLPRSPLVSPPASPFFLSLFFDFHYLLFFQITNEFFNDIAYGADVKFTWNVTTFGKSCQDDEIDSYTVGIFQGDSDFPFFSKSTASTTFSYTFAPGISITGTLEPGIWTWYVFATNGLDTVYSDFYNFTVLPQPVWPSLSLSLSASSSDLFSPSPAAIGVQPCVRLRKGSL